MQKTNIYVLIDPRDNKVRYVGKANNVSQRYKAHLNRARKHQIHKANWIKQLKELGLKPIIEVIDVVPVDEWIYWETYWIGQFKAWGFDLINYTNGGDGCTFGNQTSFKKGQGGKKVIGYNSNCEKVYEFDSMRQAEEFLGTRSMWGVLREKRKTCKGFAWFYSDQIKTLTEEEIKEKIKQKFITIKKPNSGSFIKGQPSKQSIKLKVIDVTNEEVKVFNNGNEAAKFIGVTQPTISWALKNAKLIRKRFKIKKYG